MIRRRHWYWLFALFPIGIVVFFYARNTLVSVPEAEQLSTYGTQPYRRLLAACVHDGMVDYRLLKNEYETELNQYLDAVGRFGPESTPELFTNTTQQLAYYLNAYNAIMLWKWLDADAANAEPDFKVNRLWFISNKWKVDSRWVLLDSLEQSIIRPRFKEPRAHFALVCGAISCPPLLNEPFEAAKLDDQLEGLARQWLTEPDGLVVKNDHTVSMSSIFDWYYDDFASMGGLSGVLDRYLDRNDSRRVDALDAAKNGLITFLDYDWSINTVTSSPDLLNNNNPGSNTPK